ncbi:MULTISPECIES: nucleotidyltransferase domain-containing protein [unclassified Streptomyces]|uniref:nucleotidyltransferase domain-containing protein n=1 Tax=unclassified Streptomyces TaxID=2593676 RepID=UPI00081DCA41|nr:MULTISPECIES: nucleotidyltransferase domain-containing protein [unclassified Streptomyces]MYZ37372.1 DNA polymerase subunit beta [Streptomyces sp. SID4917]SCF90825.1 Nucleotidyltransferase domain-containing protein [Streptomyces sp. MnatMP-M17]
MNTAPDAALPHFIDIMAARLTRVRGVRAVTLGGSRARGTHRPDSDWDLGVYYRGGNGGIDGGHSGLDRAASGLGRAALAELAELAAEMTGSPVEVAGPGEWGPWVNGGAWLSVDGVAVDWILRDLHRVERVWEQCREGRFEVGTQPGHPLGSWSPAYAGEVALCRVLADPTGELTALREAARAYPEPLRRALAEAAWEADFSVAAARKSAGAGDALHVSLCLSRAFGILVQALLAHHRVWCLNEKGATATAAALPDTPPDFAARIARALRSLDAEAVEAAGALVTEVRTVLDSGT